MPEVAEQPAELSRIGRQMAAWTEALGAPPDGVLVEESRPGVFRLMLPRSGYRWQAWMMTPFLLFFMGVVGWMTVKMMLDPGFPYRFISFLIPFWVIPPGMFYFVVRTWFAAKAMEFEDASLVLCVRMPLCTERRQSLARADLQSISVDSNLHAGMWNFLLLKTARRMFRFGAGVDRRVLEWVADRICAWRVAGK